MKIDFKTLLLSIIIPVFLGSFVGFLTAPFNNYYEINQPFFAPPGIVFPIVWTILYVYGIQLIINLLWGIWFFVFRFYLLSFIWILLLIGFVVGMIKKFYYISKVSAYLQIPYLLWLIFAAILNLFVFFLNM